MLSSRERLLRCIRHQSIDRVPVSTYELNGWNEDEWENHEPSYAELMAFIRDETDCVYMYNPPSACPEYPDDEVESWREGTSTFTRVTRRGRSGSLVSLSREDEGVHTSWTLKHPLEAIDDIDTFLGLRWQPPVYDMNELTRRQELLGERGVVMMSVADPICVAAELFEMGTFLVHALTESERVEYFLDALHERQMESLRQMCRYDVKDVLFRICGPEYATPPYLPATLFPRLVTKYLIPMCRAILDAGAIPRIHSHGKIAQVLDEFARTGALALDPVEPPPDGDIALSEVKRKYGKQFCLFGNIELKELEFATPERIDALVREAMDAAKEGSGFVLMPTASPINVPLSKVTERNYRQMVESALKYGKY